jgi:hypothetical protein
MKKMWISSELVQLKSLVPADLPAAMVTAAVASMDKMKKVC